MTVAALTTGAVPANQRYWVCRRVECEVVYFGEDATLIAMSKIGVVPGFKSKSSDALLCYCFRIRRADIEAELAEDGKTTIADHIAAQVRLGNCACEVRNPTGRCCLGAVKQVISELRAVGAQAGR